jgi:nitrite reductase/ring-hydroxylating ferredoxin subunit
MSDRIEVCPADALAPGERRIVDEGSVSIGVFNVDGEYHAMLNTCPHQQGPVCEGEITNRIDAEFEKPGQSPREKYTDDQMVVCPWHAWAFDITTGKHVGEPDISVPTFDVVVEDGMLYIDA